MDIKKTTVLISALLSMAIAGTSVSFSLSASTGDSDFDLTLSNINVEAKNSLPGFYSSMSVQFGTPPSQLDYLIYKMGFSPADAFMAIRLSILIGKPIETVCVTYDKHRHKGWGAIAKELGIKPGSKEFHQLKNGGVLVLQESKKKSGAEINVQIGSDDKKSGKDKGNGKGKGKKK